MANEFNSIRNQLMEGGINPRSEESRDWFMDKIQSIGRNLSRDSLMRKPPLKPVERVLPGQMYLFYYDPKHADSLPYYDSFPLIFLLDTYRGGMSGINLHYLPMGARQTLFYNLLQTLDNPNIDEESYLKITYKYLAGARSLKEYRPCYKKYLTKHVKGNIVKVPATEWEAAVHLPLALWRKADETRIHRESESIIERY